MTATISTKHKYLIIGGTTKAATTSLYNYLADHPQVSASTLKETRFFLDLDYPVPPLAAKWTDGIEKYEEFFNNKQGNNFLRLEASAEYLYSEGTPKRIKESLPNAKIVFLLREPVSRVISWYKFAKQRADIPAEMSLDGYIEQQLQSNYFQLAKQQRVTLDRNQDKSIPPSFFLSALEHGCYSSYLRPYFEILGRDNVRVAFYEELCNDPKSVLEEICSFAEIDPNFYHDYTFKVFNRSETMKNASLHGAYGKLRTSIRKYTHNLPIHDGLRMMRKWFDTKIYYRLNTRPTEQLEISPAIQTKLKDYYQEEITTLENLLDRPIPWYKG